MGPMLQWIAVVLILVVSVAGLYAVNRDRVAESDVFYYYDGERAVHCWVYLYRGGISCWPEKFVKDPAPGIGVKSK